EWAESGCGACGGAPPGGMAVPGGGLFIAAEGELAAHDRPAQLWSLALVLAAIVNIKQTGFGLVAALAGAGLISAWTERGIPRAAVLRVIALPLLPAICVHAIWRYHVAHAGVPELTPLPF